MAEPAPDESDSIYPYPGVTRSFVWKYFGFKKKKEGPPSKQNLDMDTVICKLCRKAYANKGNTTNLQFHLDKHHGHELDGKSKSQNVDNSVTKKMIQPKITGIQPAFTHPRVGITVDRKKNLDDLTLKLLIGKVLPISTVYNSHFLALVKELDPRYTPPTKHGILKLLKEKKVIITEKVAKDLPTKSGSMAITHDGWSSCATESYSTVTGHFISSTWELRSVVLHTAQVQGSHTSEKIADGLKETVATWNLPNPTCVTDNAANEKKAVEILGWERSGCYGHRINLIVKNALEVTEVNKILSKCRKLVGHFHKSTSLNDCLIEKQATVFSDSETLIGHKLIIDCPTRWNSSLDMLRRVLEQTPAIMAVASDKKINKNMLDNVKACCLSFEELSIVEDLVQILEPFQRATSILCAELNPTMNKVLVTFEKVKKVLDNPNFSNIMKKVVSKMKEEICKRITDEEIPLMAAMLSPDTKNLSFMSESERISAHQLLLTKALSVSNVNIKQEKNETVTDGSSQNGSSTDVLPKLPSLDSELIDDHKAEVTGDETVDDNGVSSAKKIKCVDLEDWFDDVFVVREDRTSESVAVEKEVTMYLGSSKSAEDGDITLLHWWQRNEFLFPRLGILARKYLAIPASSVPSERVFSLCGNLITKKRSRMKPALVNSIVFLKMNMDLYW